MAYQRRFQRNFVIEQTPEEKDKELIERNRETIRTWGEEPLSEKELAERMIDLEARTKFQTSKRIITLGTRGVVLSTESDEAYEARMIVWKKHSQTLLDYARRFVRQP